MAAVPPFPPTPQGAGGRRGRRLRGERGLGGRPNMADSCGGGLCGVFPFSSRGSAPRRETRSRRALLPLAARPFRGRRRGASSPGPLKESGRPRQSPPCRPLALWQPPALGITGSRGRSRRVPSPRVHPHAGSSVGPRGSSCVTRFEAGLAGGGQRGWRSAGGVAVASLLACFSEAMLCVCNSDYPSGLPLSRSSFPLT